MAILRFSIGVFISLSLTGCLTIPEDQNDPPVVSAFAQRKTANLDFSFENVGWQGTRVIYTKEQSESLKAELISVLEEFGVDVTEKPSELKINAGLRIKDVGCKTFFIDSNCLVMLFLQPASLYLIPTSIEASHELTLSIASGDESAKEMVRAVGVTTYVHLILTPLLPLEFWTLKNAEFRKNLYREILAEISTKNAVANLDSGI